MILEDVVLWVLVFIQELNKCKLINNNVYECI